jgi:hypothetical protein
MRRAFRVCCPQRPMRGARGRLAIAGVGAGALARGQHAKKALWADGHSFTCRAGAGGAAPDLRAAAFTAPLPNRCAQGSEGDRHLHCISAPNICRQMSAPGDTRALGESTQGNASSSATGGGSLTSRSDWDSHSGRPTRNRARPTTTDNHRAGTRPIGVRPIFGVLPDVRWKRAVPRAADSWLRPGETSYLSPRRTVTIARYWARAGRGISPISIAVHRCDLLLASGDFTSGYLAPHLPPRGEVYT